MFCLTRAKGTSQVPQPDATLAGGRDVRQWSTPSVPPPVQVSPYPYESFESLMFRVAECNALGSARGALRALGAQFPRPSRYCYKYLSPLLGIEPATLAAIVPTAVDGDLHILGHQLLRDRHIVRHASRFCPMCVSERGYGALEWGLAPYAVCAEHGIYLVDRCACNPRRSLNMFFRHRYFTCVCGADLRNAAVVPASSAACKLAKEIRRRFRQEPDQQLDSVFPILNTWPEDAHFGDFLDLMICLGSLARESRAISSHLRQAVYRLDRVTVQFENAADVLSSWRGGFASAFRIANPTVYASRGTSDKKFRLLRARAKRYLPPLVYRWLALQRI
ncbi:TniQ family protein [Cupriavidus sp. UYPR2.512]|uniref:TniQ family protein n=1 Tax=Cupriavidus sp. UYPR2.512 TaxID=1080187 RepID=UPI0009DA76F9|nr:TniQ family protein [Cupriavidus necator]